MDFGFIPFLLFVIFVVVRIVKLAANVEQGRPGADGPLQDLQDGVEGARNISDFLEDLKSAQSADLPSAASYEEKQKLREHVREAARRNREMKTRVFDTPPPVVQAPASLAVHASAEEDFFSVSAKAAYSEKVSVNTPGGLAHPVFSGALNDPSTIAKRAIVLREVLGPPIGLR